MARARARSDHDRLSKRERTSRTWFGRRDPDARGYFGEFGGRFVPETLVAPIQALEDGILSGARRIAAFADRAVAAADALRRPRDAALGRAAACASTAAARAFCSSARTSTHTGAHKINNALGQALLAVRMGKKRIVAETGAGQHGVASATACALLGLECVVYMGAEDMARQALNVFRMRLLGAEVRSVDARQPDAQGRDQRGDARLGGERPTTPTTCSARRWARIPIR